MNEKWILRFLIAFLVLAFFGICKHEYLASKQERKILLETYSIVKGDPQYKDIQDYIEKTLNLGR